jgi:hypothetical protein
MTEDIITKRLHISGLTPAITAADLSQKLGSFGSVKALDGFGKLDALEQPRKYGYVTIETTKPKLARCTYVGPSHTCIYAQLCCVCMLRYERTEWRHMEGSQVANWRS